MGLTVAVIIPTLNEQQQIAASIHSAQAAGASEVIVVDGGSADATIEIAERAGARVMTCARGMRAAQLNVGAAASAADILLFLHADTELPAGASRIVEQAIGRGYDCGGFRLHFKEANPKLRLAATLINLRTRLTKAPWGDQAQFLTRMAFEQLGGFRELPLMEDYDLAQRARRSHRPVLLDAYVRTSGRRFMSRGVLRTAYTNWRIIIGFHLGEDPATLAARYRGRSISRRRHSSPARPRGVSSDAHDPASD